MLSILLVLRVSSLIDFVFLITVGVVAVAGLIFWKMRVAAARRRLAAVDRGEICIGCESRDVKRVGETVICNACGYSASIAGLRNAHVSEQEIKEVNRPDNHSTLP